MLHATYNQRLTASATRALRTRAESIIRLIEHTFPGVTAALEQSRCSEAQYLTIEFLDGEGHEISIRNHHLRGHAVQTGVNYYISDYATWTALRNTIMDDLRALVAAHGGTDATQAPARKRRVMLTDAEIDALIESNSAGYVLICRREEITYAQFARIHAIAFKGV